MYTNDEFSIHYVLSMQCYISFAIDAVHFAFSGNHLIKLRWLGFHLGLSEEGMNNDMTQQWSFCNGRKGDIRRRKLVIFTDILNYVQILMLLRMWLTACDARTGISASTLWITWGCLRSGASRYNSRFGGRNIRRQGNLNVCRCVLRCAGVLDGSLVGILSFMIRHHFSQFVFLFHRPFSPYTQT